MQYYRFVIACIIIMICGDAFSQTSLDHFNNFKKYRLTNSDSAFHYAMLAIQKATEEKDSLMLVKSNNAAGYVNMHTGKLQKALEHYHIAYNLAVERNYYKQQIYLSNNLGLVLDDIGRYDEALKYYLLSLELREKHKNVAAISVVKNNIGLIYYKLKQYHNALKFLKESKDEGDDFKYISNVAMCLIGLNEYDSALTLYQSIIDFPGKKDSTNLVSVYSGMGIIHYIQSNIPEATKNFKLSEKYASRFHDKLDRVVNNHYLALLSLEKQDYDSCSYYLSKSIKMAEEMSSALWLKNNYLVASRLNEYLDNHAEALQYHKKYIHINDSLINGRVIENIENLHHAYENRKHQEYLASLDKDLIQKSHLNTILGGIGIISVAGIFYFYYSSSRNKKKRELISKAFADVERKKKRLEEKISTQNLTSPSSDFNSYIQQTTEGLKDPLENLRGLCNIALVDVKDPVAIKYFNKVELSSERLKNLLKRIDDIYYILSAKPKILEVNLYELVDDILKSTDKKLKDDVLHNIIIPEGLRVQTDPRLLRIILSNIVHNAFRFRLKNSPDFSFVSVNYKMEDHVHLIEVIDNGYGIEGSEINKIFSLFGNHDPQSSKSTGLGLHLSALAAQQLNGNITVDSIPLVKTSFTVSLPIEENIGVEA